MHAVVVVVLGHMVESLIDCLFHNVSTVPEYKSDKLSDVVFGDCDIALLSDVLLEVCARLAGHIFLDIQLLRELVPDAVFQLSEECIVSILERSIRSRELEYIELVVFGDALAYPIRFLQLSRALNE